MIAKFFQKSKPQSILVLHILLLIFYISTLFQHGNLDFSIFNVLVEIGFFFLIVLFLLISNFIIRKNDLTYDNSYVILLLVILFGTFYEAFLTPSMIYANLALLLGFRKIYSLRTSSNIKKKLFDSGFWIGVAALFYMPSTVYLLMLLGSVFIFGKAGIKRILMPVLGFIAPIVIVYTYHLYGDTEIQFFEYMTLNLEYSIIYYLESEFLMPLLFLLLVGLISVLINTPKIVMVSNNFRSSWSVLMLHFFISLGLVLMSVGKSGSELMLLFFPSAVVIVNFIQKMKSQILKNLVLYAFLGLVLWRLFYSF